MKAQGVPSLLRVVGQQGAIVVRTDAAGTVKSVESLSAGFMRAKSRARERW